MADSSSCVVRSSRDEKPVHYILKLQSFSLLKDALIKLDSGRYESQIFNAGGYQWKLALYPNGDKKIRNGCGHVSLYLVLADDNILSTFLEVKAVFTFLVYDTLKDNYLTIQDGKIRRFSAINTEWGIDKLVSLETFNDSSNGLLVDDCCVFGVDIFVMNCEDAKGEAFSLIKEPKNYEYIWKVDNFSQLDIKSYRESNSFKVESARWKIRLYPNRDSYEEISQTKPGFLSLYLMLDNFSDFPRASRLYVEYEMAILDQLGDRKQKVTYYSWFGFGHSCFGIPKFLTLTELKKPNRSLIWNDSLVISVKINVISTFNKIGDSLKQKST